MKRRKHSTKDQVDPYNSPGGKAVRREVAIKEAVEKRRNKVFYGLAE